MDIVWKFTLKIFQLKMTLLNWVILYIKFDSFSHIFLCLFCFDILSHPVKCWIMVLRDLSRFFQFPIITDICIYLCNSLLFLPSLNLFSNSHLKMDTILEKFKKYFPALPPNAIAKIYRARCARLRLLMNHGIPENIRWLIEAKV